MAVLVDFARLVQGDGQAPSLALRDESGVERRAVVAKSVKVGSGFATFAKKTDFMEFEPPVDLGASYTLAFRCRPKRKSEDGYGTPCYGYPSGSNGRDDSLIHDSNHFVLWWDRPRAGSHVGSMRARLAVHDPLTSDGMVRHGTASGAYDIGGLRFAQPEFDLIEFAGTKSRAGYLDWLNIVVVVHAGRTTIAVKNARGEERSATCEFAVTVPLLGIGGLPNECQAFGDIAFALVMPRACNETLRTQLLDAETAGAALPGRLLGSAGVGGDGAGDDDDDDVQIIDAPPGPVKRRPAATPSGATVKNKKVRQEPATRETPAARRTPAAPAARVMSGLAPVGAIPRQNVSVGGFFEEIKRRVRIGSGAVQSDHRGRGIVAVGQGFGEGDRVVDPSVPYVTKLPASLKGTDKHHSGAFYSSRPRPTSLLRSRAPGTSRSAMASSSSTTASPATR